MRHAALPALLAIATALPAVASDDVYVVAGRHTLDAAFARLDDATPWTDSLGTPLAVARLDAEGVATLVRHVHEVERRCGGFFAFGSRPEAEAFLAGERARDAVDAPHGFTYTIDNAATVEAWLPQVDAGHIRDTIATLSAWRNRWYLSSYGAAAASWIRDDWLARAGDRDDVEAELFNDCDDCGVQPSVILTVRGAELPDEIVVVGGHLDSINGLQSNNPEQVAPGADDDASGIATIGEIIRVALADGWRPRRTVKFMGYAAEEVGLRGSRAIASRFAADGANVVGVLQLDMTNYKAGTAYDMQLISDRSSSALNTFLGELFDTYLAPGGLTRTSVACNYGCSDHASWTAAGFPAAMMFEAGEPREFPGDLGAFPYIHSTQDTLANMGDSAGNSVKFARLGLAFIGELAKTAQAAPGDILFVDGFEGG